MCRSCQSPTDAPPHCFRDHAVKVGPNTDRHVVTVIVLNVPGFYGDATMASLTAWESKTGGTVEVGATWFCDLPGL